MSVCLWPSSLSTNRMPMPRGLPLASVSGRSGIPVELEKRTITGVDELLKCGAFDSEAASAVGVKVPLVKWPLACASKLSGVRSRVYVSVDLPGR